MKTTTTREEVSSPGLEKRVERIKWPRSAPCTGEKRRADRKMDLQKPLEEGEHHERSPRWSWIRNQMGNPELMIALS